jgi:hypothetical protein
MIFMFLIQLFNATTTTVEWLTILLCIQEVPLSNLGPDTGYPG